MPYVHVDQVKNISSAMERSVDLVIVGAGIAGLWANHYFKRKGYDCLLLENNAIAHGQTIAAQGIIHSGLKFSLAGKVNTLAHHISKMPDIWRACLIGNGPVNASGCAINAQSQMLLIPSGIVGGITKVVTQKLLGNSVYEIHKNDWPQELQSSGFNGSAISMNELVIDIPSLTAALAEPYKNSIRKYNGNDPIAFLESHKITAKKVIFTSAQSNHDLAKAYQNDSGLQTQIRPLLQGLIKNAPFPLFAHLVGTSEKPVMTITTHKHSDGSLIWYLGASVAERSKDTAPNTVYADVRKALKNYLPNINPDNFEWATFPIDRIEGKSNSDGWMPDTPTIHKGQSHYYCWPTKLTFAPLLSEMLEQELLKDSILPSNLQTDFDDLEIVNFALPPWETVTWTK